MKIKFKSESAIIYDFFRVIVAEYNDIRFMDATTKTNISFSNRARESYEYIWQNLNTDVPGLPIFFSNENNNSMCFMYHMFDYRLHEFNSINQLLYEAFDGDIEYIQLALLRFFDDSNEADEFYKNLIKKPVDMVNYIEKLDLNNIVKWDLINFICNPNDVLTAMKNFCNKVKSKLNHVYKKYAKEIRDFSKYISSKLKVNPSVFMDNEINTLYKCLPDSDIDEYIVSYSFINEILVSSYKTGNIWVILLGIRYEQHLGKYSESARIRNYEPLFKSFADKNRLLIIELLMENEMCVTDIAATLNLAFTTTSYHLEVMYSSGILTNSSVGKKIYYSIDKNFVANSFALLKNSFQKKGGTDILCRNGKNQLLQHIPKKN